MIKYENNFRITYTIFWQINYLMQNVIDSILHFMHTD